MQTLTLETVREDASAREAFLNNLLRKNNARIYRMLILSFKPGTQMFSDLISGDLQQAFLLGAHRAIEKFREHDDGRGKNDYSGFCSWAGLNAVRDRIREAYREQRIANRQTNMGTFATTLDGPNINPMQRAQFSQIAQVIRTDDTTQKADEHEMIVTFLSKLSEKDRIVAESFLLGYGPAQRNNDPFEKGRGRRQNYIHEMEMVTGYSEQKLMASIQRLRKSAAEHWGIQYA